MYTGNCSHSIECNQWEQGCQKCPNKKRAIKSYLFDSTSKNWNKMQNAFETFNDINIVSVSPWLEKRARKSEILKLFNHQTILNGINISIFHQKNKNNIRKKYGFTENDKIILHVTSGFKNPIKGGRYIIEIANILKDEDIKIILVGKDLKNIELPSNIINFGLIEEQEKLADMYNLASCTCITSEKETFGMVVAESISCGTPVVGFKAGAPEMIGLDEYCEFVEFGNVEALIASIKKVLANNKVYPQTDYYSKEKMIEQYLKIYSSH